MKYISARIEYDTNRWQCNSCKTKFEFGDNAWDIDSHCPCCGNMHPDYILSPIPDYETPEQYKKRTGRELSGCAAVWYRYERMRIDPTTKKEDGTMTKTRWLLAELQTAKQLQFMQGLGAKPLNMVVVSMPEPPPDDWKPEEVQ